MDSGLCPPISRLRSLKLPTGGTLYRVLFLAALLLFILTFVVNTVAELVRQNLRERYSKI